MPEISERIGVPTIQLSVNSSVAVPAVSALSFTASGVSLNDSTYNDVTSSLLPTDTYQVMVGLVGIDPVNGGYTLSPCSPSSGNLTITSGQAIDVTVPNANWPANFNYAVCACLLLKTNAGNFQIAQFNYIDPNADFHAGIMSKPLSVAPNFTTALLQSGTSDPTLGSRWGTGITYTLIDPTTGTFNFRRPVATVTVSPNNGPDFVVTTTRSVGIRFQALVNNIKAWVQAAGGNYVTYSTGGSTYYHAQMSLATAQALLRGNKPVLVTMPQDPQTGAQEIRLLIGTLTVNQIELDEAWSKTATTPVNFQFDAAILDRLITNQHVEIQYMKTTP